MAQWRSTITASSNPSSQEAALLDDRFMEKLESVCRRQIDLDKRASKEENTNKLSVAWFAFYLVQFLCDIDLFSLVLAIIHNPSVVFHIERFVRDLRRDLCKYLREEIFQQGACCCWHYCCFLHPKKNRHCRWWRFHELVGLLPGFNGATDCSDSSSPDDKSSSSSSSQGATREGSGDQEKNFFIPFSARCTTQFLGCEDLFSRVSSTFKPPMNSNH